MVMNLIISSSEQLCENDNCESIFANFEQLALKRTRFIPSS